MAFLAKSTTKALIWLLRVLQHFFALILIGICGYMLQQFSHFKYRPPQEVVVPILFSCLALVVSFFSLIAICCLPYMLQLVAAFLDFAILSGFIACAVLLADNFHQENKKNPLFSWLVYIRLVNDEKGHVQRSGALVKMLDAGVCIMIVLFFLTTLLSVFLAMLSTEEQYEHARHEEVIEIEEARELRR